MNDADGSSSAAQGAQQLGDKTQAGLIGRLFSWSPGKSELEADGAIADGLGTTGSASLPGIGNLRRKRVEDVAVPKGEIGAISVDATLDQLVSEFRESGFTRLPVYEGTLDTPLGMIHLKDVALEYGFNGGGKEFDLRKLLRPVLFVPPSMPLGVLLQKMQSQRMHLALVIDEYGGTDGLVTIEDLIEQVIGEIEDEHDVDEAQPWIQEAPGTYLALARAPLDEFEAETGIALVGGDIDEDVDSLGGLVFLLSGRVPARGEIIKHPGGAEFEVVDADARRVKRLRIRSPRPEKTGD